MKCTDVVPLFSARFDGELSADELKSFEKHCASCASCASEWQEFQSSTRALREVGVPAVPEDYVDSLVAAALGAAGSGDAAVPLITLDSRRKRKLLVSHAAAVLLGAALVLFLFWMSGSDWMRGQSQNVQPAPDESPIAIAVPETEIVEPKSAEPQVEPKVEVVERIVERIRYLPHPTQISEEARLLQLARLTTAVSYFADAFRELSDKVDAHALEWTPIAQAPEAVEHSPSEPESVAPELPEVARPREASPVAIARLNSPIPARTQAAIAIQRDGDQLSLETSGSLDEIVPALIAHINDEDAAVSALVQQRLRDIWSDRTGGDPNAAPYGRADETLPTQDIGWRRWFARGSNQEHVSDPVAEWNSWWSQESSLLAQAGI